MSMRKVIGVVLIIASHWASAQSDPMLGGKAALCLYKLHH